MRLTCEWYFNKFLKFKYLLLHLELSEKPESESKQTEKLVLGRSGAGFEEVRTLFTFVAILMTYFRGIEKWEKGKEGEERALGRDYWPWVTILQTCVINMASSSTLPLQSSSLYPSRSSRPFFHHGVLLKSVQCQCNYSVIVISVFSHGDSCHVIK